MSNSTCLVFTEKQLNNLHSILGNYTNCKVDLIQEQYVPSCLGLSNDSLIKQFDTSQEIILANAHMVIVDHSILSFTLLVDSSPMVFNIQYIDNKQRYYVGNNMFIKVL
jgi:hypothetical protein